MKHTHASLFSGIGGAELAASWIGWTNVFHCEIQEFQRKVLEYWFPNSISYEDITKTDFKEWRGQIDVLTGGFPCQPFSVAGKRKGAEDNRYLWGEMLRAIRQIQPTWVVGENVAGLLSMVQPGKAIKVGRADDLFEENFIYRTEQQFTIAAICEDLECAGYSVQPFVIPACAVGAPTGETGCGLLPTAQTQGLKVCNKDGKTEFLNLELLPTPKAQEARGNCSANRNKFNLTDKIAELTSPTSDASQLNPLFVAEMMGFPLDWLALPFLSQSGEAKASKR